MGDRCLPAYPSGLHPWLVNNEVLHQGQTCDTSRLSSSVSVGLASCAKPEYEQVEGECLEDKGVSNDTQILRTLTFNDTCDLTDLRVPRKVCDTSKGLVCRNNECQCDSHGPTHQNMFIWDGNKCRTSKICHVKININQ